MKEDEVIFDLSRRLKGKEEELRLLRDYIDNLNCRLSDAVGLISIYYMNHSPDGSDNYYRNKVYEFLKHPPKVRG